MRLAAALYVIQACIPQLWLLHLVSIAQLVHLPLLLQQLHVVVVWLVPLPLALALLQQVIAHSVGLACMQQLMPCQTARTVRLALTSQELAPPTVWHVMQACTPLLLVQLLIHAAAVLLVLTSLAQA